MEKQLYVNKQSEVKTPLWQQQKIQIYVYCAIFSRKAKRKTKQQKLPSEAIKPPAVKKLLAFVLQNMKSQQTQAHVSLFNGKIVAMWQ
ncbi:MAG: hypothetical protein RR271_05890, partial [Oscillospiraceae bacterium]